jgi:methionine-S-sulfoxide reductase
MKKSNKKPFPTMAGLMLLSFCSFCAGGIVFAESGETMNSDPKQEVATLAGGCFWGVEELIRAVPGVLSTRVGYTGGHVKQATYRDVSGGQSGHAESIEILFDPAQVSYGELLDFFFRIHDPTTLNQQGNDVGSQYRSEIFYHNEDQRVAALEAINRANQSGRWKKPVVTALSAAGAFFAAEDYHQDYLQKNPGGYTCHYVRN